MAINASAVFRVRTDGVDTNGAAYDSAISGAGTDYSDQAAAQLTVTDGATSGAASTTLTSATGGFTTAMIGNAVRIASGTNFTTGYYFITARTDTNTVTLDRSPTPSGAGSSGAVKVGGAALTIKKVCDNANATNEKCVAGNTVMIRGAGTDTPGSDDYTFTGYFTPVAGSAAAGRTTLKGYNGRPRIKCDGLTYYGCSYNKFEGLYQTISSNSNGGYGVINGSNLVIYNCVIDTANQTATIGCVVDGDVLFSEVKGGRSAASTGGYGLQLGNGNGFHSIAIGCYIHDVGDHGIYCASGAMPEIHECIVYTAWGNSIHLVTGTAGYRGALSFNTLDNGKGHGIYFADTLAFGSTVVVNNIISNHAQASKYGINVAVGSTALNDRLKDACDYNVFYGNTANYNALSAGSHDTTGTNPTYVGASSGDFTPAATLDSLAFPGQMLNATGSISYMAPGAIQRLVSGGSGTVVFRRRQNSLGR